ncbi:alpha/beta hydrolase family esterase [Nonomuraea sp. LPB2021202275-12-8]|uniref:alpha/beta hydrolase family esterase n=1 Tax=Nonomuraea sp. LPB2021202275-12-8 TaxID=3120159 RepID=UPI00300D87EA
MIARVFGVASAALLPVLLVAADCGARPPVPDRPSVSAAPSAAPPAGCAGGPRLKAGRHELEFGGGTRAFLLSLPEGDGPHPVLLNLHGLGSTARQQAAYSRLPEVGARRGYIVATPQVAEDRLAWTLPHTYGPDDTGFLGALLDRLEQRLCVDRRREFAAGLSYGGGMATAMVCGLEGRLAGAAAVGGVNIVQPCRQPRPTTLVAFHGTADRVVPYEGGHPLRNSSGDLRKLADLVTLQPVEQVTGGWAGALGCASPPARSSPVPGVLLRTWKGCAEGASVRLYAIDGGGHTWPGPIEVPRLGATNRDLDATRLILDAFDAAPPT